MPTININGGGTGGGGGGGRSAAGRSLADVLNDLLRHPSMALEREFQVRWHSLMPNSGMFGGSNAGPEIAGLARTLAQLGPKYGGANARAAFPTGGGWQMASSTAQAAASVATAAARVAAAAATMSARGAGGGGFGGGAGGGGGGGAGGAGGPFGTHANHVLHGLGLGRLARAGRFAGAFGRLGALGRVLGGIGLAGAAAYEVATLPQAFAGLEGKALGGSKLYADTKTRAFELARGGGASAEDLFGSIYPGSLKVPPWMRAMGLGPGAALQSLGAYGILPSNARTAQRLMSNLRMYGLSPAFAGMPEGTVEATARAGAGIGIANPTSPQGYLAAISRILEEAVSKGMDRARVLNSLNETFDRMSTNASGLNREGTLNLFHQLMTSGLPGGRTGALQAQAISGIEGAIGGLGNNPASSVLMFQAMQRAGLKDQASLRRFLGPETYDSIAGTHAGRFMLQGITTEMGAGRAGIAMSYLREAMRGHPARFASLMHSALPSFGDQYVSALAGSNVTGMGMAGFLGTIFGDHIGKGEIGARTGMFTTGMMQKLGSPLFSNFYEGNDYASMLKAAGVPANLVGDFVDAGRKYGMNPVVLAALARTENSGFNAKLGGPGVGIGIGQITQRTARSFGFVDDEEMLKDPRANIFTMAGILAKLQHKKGGNILNAIGAYGPQTPGGPETEMNHFIANLQKMTGTAGLPEDVFHMNAAAGQSLLYGASASFHEFGTNIDWVNQHLQGFAATLTDTGIKVKEIVNWAHDRIFGPQHP